MKYYYKCSDKETPVYCQDKTFMGLLMQAERERQYTPLKASEMSKNQRLIAKEIPVPAYSVMWLVQNATCDMGLFSTVAQAMQYKACCQANLYYNEQIEGIITISKVLVIQQADGASYITYKLLGDED